MAESIISPVRVPKVGKSGLFVENRGHLQANQWVLIGKNGEIGMKSITEMSNEELLRAIDLCIDTGTSVTPRGFADDYAIASLGLAKAYRQELAKREQTQKRKDFTLV